MGPVLEQLAGGDGVGDQRAGVRPEAGEQRQLLAAHEHVDGVDLDQADVVEHAAEVPAGDPAGRPRPGEALGGERDAAGRVGGETSGHQPGRCGTASCARALWTDHVRNTRHTVG